MGLFAYKKSDVEIQGYTTTTLGCDWEKDSFSILFNPKKEHHVVVKLLADKDYIITDCRPAEAGDKVPETDLYAIAVNKEAYKFKEWNDGSPQWVNREPTEVEKYFSSLFEDKGNPNPSWVLIALSLDAVSVSKAKALGNSEQVFMAKDPKGEEPAWVKLAKNLKISSGSSFGNRNYPKKSFSESAEEKLVWLENLDLARLRKLPVLIGDYEISTKEVILTILKGE